MSFDKLPLGRRTLLLFGLLAGVVFCLASLYRTASPHLLLPEGSGHWVVSPNPANLAAQKSEPRFAVFRALLKGPATSTNGTGVLRSLGQAEIFINGHLVGRSTPWHGRLESATVDLSSHLKPGDNEISVVVAHSRGPAAILFFSDTLGVASGFGWETSIDGQEWSMAKLASNPEPRPSHLMRWNTATELLANLGLLSLLAIAGGTAALALGRIPALVAPGARSRNLAIWRWALLAGLVALYAWNFHRLPPQLGMDATQHVQYVDYILKHGSLPFADQGWQMFQPPLAYLAGAAVESMRAWVAPYMAIFDGLRLLTMACSLATAGIACRICELAFERASTAAVAMPLATFLPASLYMGQAFGNEPFAALFGTLLVFEATRLLVAREALVPPGQVLRIGLWLGLGLLAKPSVVLLLPGILTVAAWRQGFPAHWRGMLRSTAAILVLAGAIAGWWYGRNFLRFGSLFIGGWEPRQGLDWWQYPGYRIPEHWLRFGESLVRPFYSGLDSFWDGIYSTLWLDGTLSGLIRPELMPPWNLSMMTCVSVLSLPIMVAIAAGAYRAAWQSQNARERNLGLFAAAQVALFVAAMIMMFGQVPAYSAAKGSYLLSVAACLPILFGLGVAPLMERPAGRIAVAALSSGWLGFVILGFVAR